MRSGFPTSSKAPRGWGGCVDVSRDGCVCWGGVHGTAPLFRVPLGTASVTLSEEVKPRMPQAVHFVSLSCTISGDLLWPCSRRRAQNSPSFQALSCVRAIRAGGTGVMELWDKNQGLFRLGNPLLKRDPCSFYIPCPLHGGTEE